MISFDEFQRRKAWRSLPRFHLSEFGVFVERKQEGYMVSDQAYYQLLEENSRLERQLSALREALQEAVDRDAYDELGNDAPWLAKALAALRESDSDD